MMNETFELTPAAQPVADDPMVFTLRALDQRGYLNMTAAQSMGAAEFDGMVDIAARYVVGWRGAGQPTVTDPAEARRRFAAMMSGPPDVHWMNWAMMITQELIRRASPQEGDAKKS